MAKLILSPLFIALIILWPLQLWQLLINRHGRKVSKIISITTLFLLLFVTLFSLQEVNDLLYKSLEEESMYAVNCPKDAVVVLGGGYYYSDDDEKTPELNGESALRVVKGVQVFRECNTLWLVFSGRARQGLKEKHGELMRELALQMGVPQERIIIETDSLNTREHSIYLKKLGRFGPKSNIAIVTSPWHLKRAMIEFKHYFPLTVPVAAYYIKSSDSFGLKALVPSITTLDLSTTMLHEYIGMLWYGIEDKFLGNT